MSEFRILEGDVLTRLAELPAGSFDGCLTDPPYGLKFMGKSWDHGVPGPEVWAEVLRVLKPGAMLLAFGGTRTHHRLWCAIEDAGFEVRDCLMWLYGSGFPKSLDISKAIDKAAGVEREVVAHQIYREKSTEHANHSINLGNDGDGKCVREWDITAPATDAAKQWDGYGTALKPAHEPICLAMKPLDGTFANNALKWEVSGLNIEGCLVSPLTAQRPCGKVAEGDHLWAHEKNLCASCARRVEGTVKHVTPATRGCSAGNPAEPTMSGKGESIHVDTSKTDTGCFAGQSPEGLAPGPIGNSSLNTGECGKTPTGQSEKVTKSTTSTETGQTTDSKTCAACGYSITVQDTTGNMPASKNGMPNTPNAQGSAAPVGRWPSNLIHDGSDEVVRGFPETVSTKLNCTQQGRYGQTSKGDERLRVRNNEGFDDSGSAARFFYVPKADAAERRIGGVTNTHPTVKPIELCAYLAKLILPPERDSPRRLLVPFSGSGSEIMGALRAGWDEAVGIDNNPEYVTMSRERIRADSPLFNVEAE